jgi:hypothetical protein
MISLEKFMQTSNYRITEGSDYGWNCYGSHAYSLSSWNGVHGAGGYSLDITFDTQDQTVYEVTVCDYTNDRAYRLINPDFVKANENEATSRGSSFNEAYEGVDYVDLDVDADWLEKAQAIVAGEDYDTRVQMQIDFSDEDLLKYMKAAHDMDITFNQYIVQALRAAIDKYKIGSNYEQRDGQI